MTEPNHGGEPAKTVHRADASVLRTGPDAPSLPRAEVCETHTAVVLFVGDRAYKVKKPVDLEFLDYTTVAARRAACEREVALNRRFAPDVYLGVGELRSPDTGVPKPLVVMRRMPSARRLSRLVRGGAPVDDVLRAVARQLATRHADAPRSREVDEQGTSDALLSRWAASFAQVRAMADDGLPLDGVGEVGEVERLVRRYLSGRKRLFDARIGQGRVVDGHGDLLADDIFCLDDGPRVLDCLEFDDRLRHVDGLDDAAFAALLDRASTLLSAGESVVLDATWSHPAQREAAQHAAERTSADLVAVYCRVPGDVSAARLSTRAPDADLDVATAMATAEPSWPEAVTSSPLEAAVVQALAAVRPYGADQAPVFRRPYMEPD
ncbi:bifunctional aminoglycoside phosphotransferase/ATP-binding protein [Streptomyces sp. NRRL WC-3618]|uniref:bifunctional aminoglycoside phosphotransferase/ATP-binding protein n=1 Tax=Streptomyces sp. NRRL WC-3618 TaxID=1519490 RepID=UPI00099B80BF|nr:AAA family ATPase [Streptomyces sp. NRRL WC-3618]